MRIARVAGELLVSCVLVAGCGSKEEPVQDTTPGIGITITRVVADTHETAIELTFEGVPPGMGVGPANGRPTLKDATGSTYFITRATTGGDGQSATWVFQEIVPHAGELVLDVPELSLAPRPTDPSAPPGQTLVIGPWRVTYEWDGLFTPAQGFAVSLVSPFAPGTLTVDNVVVSDEAVIVDGYIEGFTMAEVPELMMRPTLVLPNGNGVGFLSGGNGWGERRERFSWRFRAVPPLDGATLTVSFRISDHPHDRAAADSLKDRGGPDAVIVLDLP